MFSSIQVASHKSLNCNEKKGLATEGQTVKSNNFFTVTQKICQNYEKKFYQGIFYCLITWRKQDVCIIIIISLV